jgi:hypothetical protein
VFRVSRHKSEYNANRGHWVAGRDERFPLAGAWIRITECSFMLSFFFLPYSQSRYPFLYEMPCLPPSNWVMFPCYVQVLTSSKTSLSWLYLAYACPSDLTVSFCKGKSHAHTVPCTWSVLKYLLNEFK